MACTGGEKGEDFLECAFLMMVGEWGEMSLRHLFC